MSKIQTGRYADLLRKYLAMKGVEDVAAELSPEISPTFQLESELPEWEFLKGDKLMAGVSAVAGVAAVQSAVKLVNGIQSGVLCRFTKIQIICSPATIVLVERNLATANFTTLFPTVARDTRLPLLNASALIHSGQTGAVPTGESWWSTHFLSDVSQNVLQPRESFILTPNHQLQITTNENNTSLRVTWFWIERRIDALESA